MGSGTSGVTFELEVQDDYAGTAVLTGENLGKALLGQVTSIAVTINGTAAAGAVTSVAISGQDFNVSVSGSKVTFEQANVPTSAAEEVNGAMSVSISGVYVATSAQFTYDFSGVTNGAANDQFTIGDQTVTATAAATGNDVAALFDGLTINANGATYTASVSGSTVTLTRTTAGAFAGTAPAAATWLPASGAASNATVGVTGVDGVTATASPTLTQLSANETLKIGTETVHTAGGTLAAATGTTADGKYNWAVDNTGNVTVTVAAAGTAGNGSVEITVGTAAAVSATFTGGVDAVKATYTYDVTNWTSGTFSVSDGTADAVDLDRDALIAAGTTGITVGDYTATISDDKTTVTLTANDAGAVNSDGPAAAAANGSIRNAATIDPTTVTLGSDEKDLGPDIKKGSNGDWNVSTTDINNVTAADKDRLASTWFNLTSGLATEGATLKIGNTTYKFTAKATAATDIDISSGDLSVIAKKLTDAAAGNSLYTVGHDGTKITLTENESHAPDVVSGATTYPADGFDLRTIEGIQNSLSFNVPVANTKVAAPGHGLTLQIGDTAETFNQLKVNIRDMHVNNLGQDTEFDEDTGITTVKDSTTLADISIADQDSAAKAVDVIKRAINQVSDVRGTLGATQNRLDHTINNLSVMTENIQDAESTIRDVDVAEEMMAYTKNNILIQSAQAMLAQANQVPQGVLQLLQ